MNRWTLRDTVLVLFMLVVVVVMIMQMVQNDRLYDRVTTAIRLIEAGHSPGPYDGGPSASSRPTTAEAAESEWLVPGAEPGGTLIIRYNAQPANLNPITAKDVYASIVLGEGGVYETLLDRDPRSLELVGLLAESWSVSPDKLDITFKLKPQARWADGRPVTAHDAVFSFRTMMLPTVDAQRTQVYYLDCEKAEALDEHTVLFKWKKPYFKSLESSGTFTVLPRHFLDPDGLIDKDPKAFADKINSWNFLWQDKPQLGSGPYTLDSWDKVDNRVVVTRNERYWGPKPPLKRIVFRFISNNDAALQSLKAGQFDFMGLTTEQWQNQTGDPAFLMRFVKMKYTRLDSGFNYIGWNNRRKPFDDRRVRQAMSYCVNRQLINEKIFYGINELANGPFGRESKQASPKVSQWPFDPSKAKALLAEAGFKDTNGDGVLDRDGKAFEFALMMPAGSAQYEQILSLVQDELSKIGVKMKIDPYEWSVFTERLDQRNFDACVLGWSGSIEGDPYQIWHSSSSENKGSNHIGYVNKEADKLIEEARQEFDADKRNAMYHRFHEIVFEDQPYTFMFTGPSLIAVAKRVRNVQPYKTGVRFIEWWIPRAEQ